MGRSLSIAKGDIANRCQKSLPCKGSPTATPNNHIKQTDAISL